MCVASRSTAPRTKVHKQRAPTLYDNASVSVFVAVLGLGYDVYSPWCEMIDHAGDK